MIFVIMVIKYILFNAGVHLLHLNNQNVRLNDIYPYNIIIIIVLYGII